VSLGSVKRNVAPRPGLAAAHRRPPCEGYGAEKHCPSTPPAAALMPVAGARDRPGHQRTWSRRGPAKRDGFLCPNVVTRLDDRHAQCRGAGTLPAERHHDPVGGSRKSGPVANFTATFPKVETRAPVRRRVRGCTHCVRLRAPARPPPICQRDFMDVRVARALPCVAAGWLPFTLTRS
jgi:hypothetical protein